MLYCVTVGVLQRPGRTLQIPRQSQLLPHGSSYRVDDLVDRALLHVVGVVQHRLRVGQQEASRAFPVTDVWILQRWLHVFVHVLMVDEVVRLVDEL